MYANLPYFGCSIKLNILHENIILDFKITFFIIMYGIYYACYNVLPVITVIIYTILLFCLKYILIILIKKNCNIIEWKIIFDNLIN